MAAKGACLIWRDNRGATAIEYGMLAGGLAVAITASVFVLGGEISDLFGAPSSLVPPGSGEMRVVLTQNFENGREGWSGLAAVIKLDQIGTGLSLASESWRGDALEMVSRTFDIPAGATRAEVSFDMSFVDSWDAGEVAKIYVNGSEVAVGEHLWRTEAPATVTPTEAVTPTKSGAVSVNANLISSVKAGVWTNGSNGTDHTYRVTIAVDDPGQELSLGFGTSLNQGREDESLLISSVELRADR